MLCFIVDLKTFIKTMNTKKTASLLVRAISVFLATQQLLFALPAPGIEVKLPAHAPAAWHIEIPENLATVENIFEAPANAAPKLILHIQNVHGQYDAQVQIKKILEYLHKEYAFNLLFVEGASKELNPDYLKLFPEKENNQKLADQMARDGQLTGPELFLADEPKDVSAVGIENADLYRADYKAFREVYAHQDETAPFIDKIDGRLELMSSRMLGADARRVLNEWRKFHQGRREFLPFVKEISREAYKFLGLDLNSLFSQAEWPQMTRLLGLQGMEADLDRESAKAEKAKLMEFLETKGASEKLRKGIERLEDGKISMRRVMGGEDTEDPRRLLELLVSEGAPLGFAFHDYPHFSLYAAYVILQSELDTSALFVEIERLFEKILTQLAATEREKNMLELFNDAELLRKLLNLELTRGEWERAGYRKTWIAPAALSERIEKLGGALGDRLSATDKINAAFDAGMLFYEHAQRRETFFYKTIRAEMTKRNTDRAVLITGGFHTEGLESMFRKDEVSYGILTPRLGEIGAKTSYVQTMLETHPTLFDLAQIEIINWMLDSDARDGQGARFLPDLQSLFSQFAKTFSSLSFDTSLKPAAILENKKQFLNQSPAASAGARGFYLQQLGTDPMTFELIVTERNKDGSIKKEPLANADGQPYVIHFTSVESDGAQRFNVKITPNAEAPRKPNTIGRDTSLAAGAEFNGGVAGTFAVKVGQLNSAVVGRYKGPDLRTPAGDFELKNSKVARIDQLDAVPSLRNVYPEIAVLSFAQRLELADGKPPKQAVNFLAGQPKDSSYAELSDYLAAAAASQSKSSMMSLDTLMGNFDFALDKSSESTIKSTLETSDAPGVVFSFRAKLPANKAAITAEVEGLRDILSTQTGQYIRMVVASDDPSRSFYEQEISRLIGGEREKIKLILPREVEKEMHEMQKALGVVGSQNEFIRNLVVGYAEAGFAADDIPGVLGMFGAKLISPVAPDNEDIQREENPDVAYANYSVGGMAVGAWISRHGGTSAAVEIDEKVSNMVKRGEGENQFLFTSNFGFVKALVQVLRAYAESQQSA